MLFYREHVHAFSSDLITILNLKWIHKHFMETLVSFFLVFFLWETHAIVTNASQGTTPISSLPYVVAKILA
jgi:hypothetical protein